MRYVSLFLLLLALIAANLLLGTTNIEWGTPGADFILREVRFPSMILALLAGASLGVAGLMMQTVMGNPLADPSILGVNAGAGLGSSLALLALGGTVTLGKMMLSGFLLTMLCAFVGALVVILILVSFSMRVHNRITLLLIGVMLSFIVGSIVSVLNYYATADGVRSYMMWGLGSFGGIPFSRLPLACASLVLPLLLIFCFVKPLDAFLMGEQYAQSIGINVQRQRTLILLIVGWLTAVTTALCGPISFIGLAAPHAARIFFRTMSHKRIIPATLILGACFALFCNVIAHSPIGIALPINALTPLIGAPIVITLLLRKKI